MIKKTILPLIFTSLIFFSCNLFQKTNPLQPDPQLLEEAVSSTLTAIGLNEEIPSFTQTVIPLNTVTMMIVTPTSTPFLTATLSPTPTQSNFKESLGTPSWNNPMDNGNGFYLDDDEYTQIDAINGVLRLQSLQSVGWHSWSMQNKSIKDFYLEGVIKINTCSGLDQYGLIFRAPDYSSGYFFGVTCNGMYNLRVFDGSDFRTIIDWTPHNAIKSGSDQINSLGVQANGGQISLYMNDQSIQQISDSTYLEGKFGIYISSFETPSFSVDLDEISYWKH